MKAKPKQIATKAATTTRIHIKNNGRIQDSHCRKSLSHSAQDMVEWDASGDRTWTVYFPNGSPFAKNTFSGISAGKPVSSGPPAKGTPGTLYKYSVKDDRGKIVDDPEILIEL